MRRGIIELKVFFRQRDAVVFTFALPAVMLLLLGSIFTDQLRDTGITASQMFTAGMIAAGVASATFVNLGIGIASDRDDGTIKRLLGVPMPRIQYFIGKLILVLVVTFAEVVVMLTVGIVLFGLKDSSRDDLLHAIRAATRGETVLAPSVAGKLWQHRHRPPVSLSPREIEVLQLVARGLSNADIGASLHVSEATVKTHLLRAFAKLDVSDRTAAVTTAMSLGIL